MPVKFYDGVCLTTDPGSSSATSSVSTFNSSSTDPVGNVVLQGFYFSYGPAGGADSERNVSWIEAKVDNFRTSDSSGKWILSYDYKYFLTDGTGSGTGGNTAQGRLKTLVLADFT